MPKPSVKKEVLYEVDPLKCRFQHSRISRSFSDGRCVMSTVAQVLDGTLSPYDLPPIEIVPLADDKEGFCSLNNRRLYVLKEAAAAGKLAKTQGLVPARLRQPKSAKEVARYSTQRCSLRATLMREVRAAAEVEGGNEKAPASEPELDDLTENY